MRIRRPVLSHLATLACVAALCSACGANLLKSSEEADPPEDAALALERGEPDKAIEILETALEDSPEDPQLLSLLSAAYAQRAGVEPLSFVQGLAGSEDEEEEATSSTDTSGLIALFDVMPEATTASLADIDYAVEILVSIPVASRMAGDPFKYAIYQTASMVMHLKILDTNHDGEISIEEMLSLSDLSATGLLAQLASSQSTLAAEGVDNETMQKAAESLAKYQAEIDAAEGATAEDRLRNYLSN